MNISTFVSRIGLICFVVFLAASIYFFAFIQLLPPGDAWLAPLIPIKGGYGNTLVFPGLDYTKGLEISGAASFFGLFIFGYFSRHADTVAKRALLSLARPMTVFGLLVGSVAYVETHLLWGEVWYGLKFVNSNPSGFPWGSERVASNTCLLPGVGDNCYLLNYDQLLLLSIAAVIAGLVISRRAKGAGAPSIASGRSEVSRPLGNYFGFNVLKKLFGVCRPWLKPTTGFFSGIAGAFLDYSKRP